MPYNNFIGIFNAVLMQELNEVYRLVNYLCAKENLVITYYKYREKCKFY